MLSVTFDLPKKTCEKCRHATKESVFLSLIVLEECLKKLENLQNVDLIGVQIMRCLCIFRVFFIYVLGLIYMMSIVLVSIDRHMRLPVHMAAQYQKSTI